MLVLIMAADLCAINVVNRSDLADDEGWKAEEGRSIDFEVDSIQRY
jgi:hypothetical protein